MSKLHVRIGLLVVVMVGALPIFGMFTTQAYRAGRTTTQRATAQKAVATQRASQRYGSVNRAPYSQRASVPMQDKTMVAAIKNESFRQQVNGNLVSLPGWANWWNRLTSWFGTKTESVITLPVITLQDFKKPAEKIASLFVNFSSINQIANNLRYLETEAQKQVLNLAMVPEKIRTTINERQKELVSYIQMYCFNHVADGAVHDEQLPDGLLHRTKQLLQKAGINPANVTLGYNEANDHDFFNHHAYVVRGFNVVKDAQGAVKTVTPAAILFNKSVIQDMLRPALEQELIHAVTHIAESHDEKLGLLQSMIGDVRFAELMNTEQARVYRQSLELNANVMMATRFVHIAGNFHEGLLYELLNNLSEKEHIQKNPPLLGPLYEHAIQCDIDKINAKFFSEMVDFKFFEKVVEGREKLLREVFKKFVSGDVYEQLRTYEKEQALYIDQQCYTAARTDVVHDKKLGNLLERAKLLLRNAGINPDAITIGLCPEGDAFAQEPLLQRAITVRDTSLIMGPVMGYRPAKLLFGQQFFAALQGTDIANNPMVDWVIGHEITHLRRHHASTTNLMLFCVAGLKKITKVGDAWHFVFDSLDLIQDQQGRILQKKEIINLRKEQELQADIMPLLHNKLLAQKVRNALESVAFTPEGHVKRELHRSSFEMLLWSNVIVRCWEQENKVVRISEIE